MRAEPTAAAAVSPQLETRIVLSMVVPVYNEAANLEAFFARLIPVLERLGVLYEVVAVNDGSSDDSLGRLLKIREQLPVLKIVNLSRNFGKD
ncbi:MAG TPA: glycosyltransferase, partial [Candidatus Binataceae bacterium]